MHGQFEDLVQVTDALYQVELAKVQKIAAEEARLRQALADLDAQARDAMEAAQNDMMALRALGAKLAETLGIEHQFIDVDNPA